MNRRLVLKQVMMAAAAAALMPSCTFDKKKATLSLSNLKIDGDQEEFLAGIVDTIIPKTDIPGARELNVHLFVLKMVDDCYEPKDQGDFAKGLNMMPELFSKQFGKSFADCTVPQREELLTGLETKDSPNSSEVLAAYKIIKRLTIQGFLTSQYVMSEIQHYEFVPGRFNGCAAVAKLSA